MPAEKQKLFSLAAVVVAAVLFGMVIAGALDFTPAADAQKRESSAPATQAIIATGVPDFAALADIVVPSVVSIDTAQQEDQSNRRRQMPSDPFHFFFGPRPEQEEGQEPMVRRSSGSGFFITSDGEVLTNNHVIEDADKLEIVLSDGSRYEAEVVGRDPATDLALIKVKEADREFPVLHLGDSENVRVGEWVMAVGNPLNMAHTVTVGVVSAMGRILGLSNQTSFENYIQTDAAINFGNSGGPLVNLRGEAIAINTAINVRGQNLGFAVPADMARQILPQLREHGEVVRGYLGVNIRNITQETQEAFGLSNRNGALVDEVVEGAPAYKAGLRHGDVIVTLDGRELDDTRDLIDLVSAMPPGRVAHLGVIRNGEKIDVDVKLARRDDADGETSPDEGDEEAEEAAEKIGISITELTPRIREGLELSDGVAGVLVTRVRQLSPAGEQGMVRGDVITEVNGQKVTSPDEFLSLVDDVDSGDLLRIYVFRPRADRSFFVFIRIE
ncbi:MAG: Do family serine endopeptidase [bacterium]|nr:Do family serine endopeptidase [bacterium]